MTGGAFACQHCDRRLRSLSALTQHSADAHPDERDYDVVCPNCLTAAALLQRGTMTCWVCPSCDAWAPCYRTSYFPNGTLTSKQGHRARTRATREFAAMRERSGISVNEAYAWMARRLGIPSEDCQISTFSHERCRELIAACREIGASLRAWNPEESLDT